ncbi:MAG: Crp/Fnr family transcriptional regulator [Bacteroidota bacterium]
MADAKIQCDCPGCDFRTVVFDNLTGEEIKIVCSIKRDKTFQKGEIIVGEGEEIKEFLYLRSGLIKIFRKGENGRDQIIHIATPYQFVSLLSVFSEKTYNYSIAALDETSVCIIDLQVIKDLIIKNGNFGLGIMEKMSKNTDNIILTSINLGKKNLRGRIAYILLLFANEIYKSDSFDLPVSRKEIAQLIDMTTENVIRIFSEFRKDGIIRINGKNIEIVKRDMLKRISDHG